MNITVDRKVIEQALEALERPTYDDFLEWASALKNARDALRAALEQPTRSQKMADAGFTPHDTRLTCDECGGQFTRQILPVHKCTALEQPEQEPVAWMLKSGHGTEFNDCIAEELKALTWKGKPMWTPLYDAPPQRKPLSDEEILTYRHLILWTAEWSYINFARAIEAAHNIKGDE